MKIELKKRKDRGNFISQDVRREQLASSSFAKLRYSESRGSFFLGYIASFRLIIHES